ncbi:MAG: PPOX class F420-dependent oxidoreductase [Crenarchaeota archaeon]|nr:MAG: PPOX class F420-dependent oxidoreductase [Thermoproteota archaeon]RDJ33218.1 MAG: PPOX class F420-dependent oxidoreductase [Thermoproteota archaeon]RDJ36279.1 MAG: PPOX class F420-dependent oxidoreductase [Thermoproteota archaeon]RDJ38908.1 MAG: PPOX class F420-dependent oxidoreductase [Thermoproteota archaeon]
MTSSKFLEDEKYINLETYKKDETPVKTPVWFVVDGEKLYVITRESTGKVKRLANNPKIKLAACSFSGNVHGDWFSGVATLIGGKEAENAVKLRKKKYGFKALLAGFMTKAKGELVVYSIVLE